MKAQVFAAAAGLATALAASAPADAQFMGNYPVIIVPPPPAQNLGVAKACAEAGQAQHLCAAARSIRAAGPVPLPGPDEGLPIDPLRERQIRAQRIGGAYWMPPLSHSSFSPRGMPSFEWTPTLRSNTSP